VAGLGFKDFSVGEVLTSANVDGYLMQQTVMRFADAGARGSALGTATGTAVPLAEGMVTYLDDQNRVELYSGTEWVPVGGVLQVVTATDSTDRSTSSTSFTDASISVSVTPKSSASTLYAVWSFRVSQTTGGASTGQSAYQITDSSDVALTGAESGVVRLTTDTGDELGVSVVLIGAVASSSTATRTYKGRFYKVTSGGGNPTIVNSAMTGRLTVLEVA